MDPYAVIQLVILFILLIFSAFFSSAETAFTTVNRVKMKTLEEDGDKRAKVVNQILEQNSKMISAILIGNNVVNISASALATTLALRIHLLVGIMTGILTIVVLMFGEIVPKTWAMVKADTLALSYSGFVRLLMTVLTPVIFLVDKLARGILLLLRIDPNAKDTITEDELKVYVDASHEDGEIESEEREMIINVFEFSDTVAKDVMIPRVNIVTIEDTFDYQQVLSVFREHMYTRIPVVSEDEDGHEHIIGLINIKDFILCDDPESFQMSDFIREVMFTHEHKKTADLLEEMRKESSPVSMVLNEYGEAVGMITLEDLLEEIVGEIRDEYDEDEKELIQSIDERTYLVEASMNLDDVNDALGTGIESEDYDSLGGFVIETLDHLPEDGETASLEDGTILTVRGVDQNRIENIEIKLPEVSNEDTEEKDTEKSIEEDS